MTQGTTPTLPITLEGIDLTAARIYLTIQDGETQALKTYDSVQDAERMEVTYDGKDTQINLTLTQEETLALSKGRATMQARWILADESAGASGKAKIG